MSDRSSGHSSGPSSRGSSFQTVNGGVSLILLTFIILSLVSFAALSIVSARADARLTEKYRQQTEYYYGARNEAQRFLQELDGGADAGAGIVAADADGLITRRFPAGPHMDLILTVQPGGGQSASSSSSTSGQNASSAAAPGAQSASSTAVPGGQNASGATAPAGADSRNYRVICEKTESTVTYNYDSTLPVMKR